MADITPVASVHSMERLQSRAPELLQQVRSISVLDDASYVEVCNQKLAAKAIIDTVDAITKNIKQKHKDALDSALIPWDRIVAPVKEAFELAERKRKEYKNRRESVTTAQVETETMVLLSRAVDETLSNAIALVDAGHVEAAEAVLNTPIEVQPVQNGPAVPKVKGIVDRKLWKLETTDKRLVVRALGAALLMNDALEAGDTDTAAWLRTFTGGFTAEDVDALDVLLAWFRPKATQQRTAFNYPGVRAWQE